MDTRGATSLLPAREFIEALVPTMPAGAVGTAVLVVSELATKALRQAAAPGPGHLLGQQLGGRPRQQPAAPRMRALDLKARQHLLTRYDGARGRC